MSIWLSGDCHAEFNRFNTTNFPKGKKLTKDDYVIILGDFGLIWDMQESKDEVYWKKWLNEKPWTTLFVDGNHENHPRLYELLIEDKFGGKVGKVSDSIYHLKRGEVYTIAGKTFFTMGGAYSVDKLQRVNHISWWKEEIPSHAEMEYGLSNLDKNGNKVDYILTHTSSREAIDEILRGTKFGIYDLLVDKVKDATVDYLTHVESIVDYKEWYFGHMHPDEIFKWKKYTCLYEHIIELAI